MLIDPNTLYEYAIPVMILTFITIFGQSISSTIGALISGQPLKQSVQTGMSLAQIGEFSFIIYTRDVNVTSDFLYPVVAVLRLLLTTPHGKDGYPFAGF
jgi:CPA2 family monovalent cation:H+ antiporter-2